MRRARLLLAALAFAAVAGAIPSAEAAEPAGPAPAVDDALARYLYVPYPDLEAVFGPGQKGVLLSRTAYDLLIAEARATARRLRLAGRPPVTAAFLDARYTGHVGDRRATVDAEFDIEVLGTGGGTVALPFDLRGAAIDSAALDGKPALIGREPRGGLRLFIPNAAPGRRTLRVKLLTRVVGRAHDSILRLTLPRVPAATATLTFDSDVEVSASAPIVERAYDKTANRTTVRLVIGGREAASRRPPQQTQPPTPNSRFPTPDSLVLTFVPNDIRRERTPLIFSDVTALATLSEGHVRLDATLAYTVLRKAVDVLRITVPADLTVNEVTEAGLLSWTVGPAAKGRKTVTVRLHEPRSSATVRLVAHGSRRGLGSNVAASGGLGAWAFPRIATEGAAVERGVLALALPDAIRARDETVGNARRINGLVKALPQAAAGFRVVREYAFWRQPYRCAVELERVPVEVVAFNNIVLRLAEQELQLTTQVTLVPRAGRVYHARVRIPADWEIIAVSTSRKPDRYTWQEIKHVADAPHPSPLKGEGRVRVGSSARGGPRPSPQPSPREGEGVPSPSPSQPGAAAPHKDILITLKHHLAVKEPLVVTIDARLVPADDDEPAKPADWAERSWRKRVVAIPEVRVMDAVEVQGQFGVWADPEFSVTPADLKGLEPVDVRELKELNGGSLALGYRFERQPAGRRLDVVRRDPRVQVETVGAVALAQGVMRSRFQLNYTIERAGQDTFRFVIDGSPTNGKIVVRGVSAVGEDGNLVAAAAVKDWDRDRRDTGPGEAWVVHTQKRHLGPVSLLVSFERAVPQPSPLKGEGRVRVGSSVGEGSRPSPQPSPRGGEGVPNPTPSQPVAAAAHGRQDAGATESPSPAPWGPGREIAAPTVRCLGVQRQSGYLLVESRDDTELTARTEGLTPVDATDVPRIGGAAPGRKVLAAYRYLSPPIALWLTPTRHAEAPVLKALVRRATLMSVLERNGRCRTRAVYRVAMARPAPLRVTLPEGAVLWTAQVGDEPVKPQIIDGALAIPIERISEAGEAGSSSSAGVTVSLFYVQDIELKGVPPLGSVTLQPPTVEGLRVAETVWDLYLPDACRYLAPRGTMRLTHRPAERPAIVQVLDAIRSLPPWLCAREAARSVGGEQIQYGLFQYHQRELDGRSLGGEVAPDTVLFVESWSECRGDLRDFVEDLSVDLPTPLDVFRLPSDSYLSIEGSDEADAGPAGQEFVTEAMAKSALPPVPRPSVHRGLGWHMGTARRTGSTMTLKVPLTVVGRRYRFRRLDASGSAGITYAPRGVYRFLTWAVFAVVVILGLLLGRVRFRRKLLYVLFVLIAASVAPSFIGAGFTGAANAGFWGGLVVAAWYIVRWLGRRCVALFGRIALGLDDAPVLGGVLRALVVIVVVALVLALGAATAAGDTVIVPYDPAHPERALESDRVYIPYSRYVDLWNLAHPNQPIRLPVAPPVDYVIHSAAYYGRLVLGGDGERSARVAFDAEFRLSVFRETWTQVRLALGGVAIREATLDGKSVQMQAVAGKAGSSSSAGGYRLHVNRPGAHVLRVLFVAPVTVLNTSGLSSVGRCAFAIPAVPVSVVELTVPSPAIEVTVSGAVGGQTEQRLPKKTLVQAHLGIANRLDFTWRPRVKAARREASVNATVTNLVTIDEAVTRLAASVRYEVAQGERQRFTLVLPPDLEVERVVGDNVRTWRVITLTPKPGRLGAGTAPADKPPVAQGNRRTLELILHRPTKTTFTATVYGHRRTGDPQPGAAAPHPSPLKGEGRVRVGASAGERPRPSPQPSPRGGEGVPNLPPLQSGADPAHRAAPAVGAYALPLIATADAGRETGRVGIRVAPTLHLLVGRVTGLEQINAAEYGRALLATGEQVGLAYRYARRPAAITVTVQRQTARVQADVRTAVHVRKDEVSVQADVDLTVRGAGAHRVRLALPAGLSRVSVAATDARGDLLENWYAGEEATRTVVTVNFLRPVLSAARVTVSGDLPKPTPDGAIRLPRVAVLDAERQAAAIAVSVARGLAVSAAGVAGFESVDAAALSAWAKPEEDERLVLGFRRREPGATAALAVRFLKPRVTAETVTNVLIDDTFVAHRFVIGYLVENAGVTQFRFSLPASLGDSVVVAGERVRQTTSTVEGAGDEARRVWTVTMQGEVLGAYRLFVYHEAPAPAAPQPGTTAFGSEAQARRAPHRLVVPRLDVLDVTRSRHFIAVQNDSQLEVRPGRVGVAETIQAADLPILPEGIRSADILAAWRCVGGRWSVDLDLIAHEGRRVQRDVVELMDVVTVVERDGLARSQITYRLTNRSGQFLELAMPPGSVLWGATVAGRPVKPATATRDGRRLLLIPLIKTAPSDLNYDAVVVFEGRIGGGFGRWGRSISTVTPEVVSMPVRKTVVTLYLPPGFVYFNDRGNLERTLASQRAAEHLAVLLEEQDRLQRLARFGKGRAQFNAWTNWKDNLSALNRQLALVDESNRMVLRGAKGVFAGRRRAEAFDQKAQINALRQQVEAFNRYGVQADQARDLPARETAGDRLVVIDRLRRVRSNDWAANPDWQADVSERGKDIWRTDSDGDATEPGEAREAQQQLGQTYQRWWGKTQYADRSQVAAKEQDTNATFDSRDLGGQMVRLRHADPEAVAVVVNRLFRQRRRTERGRGALTGRRRGEVAVQADRANKALIVLGDAANLKLVQDLVSNLDVTAGLGEGREDRAVRVISLNNADANTVAAVLRRRFGGADRDKAGRVTITIDAGTNGLVIAGGEQSLQEIEGLAKQLDAAAGLGDKDGGFDYSAWSYTRTGLETGVARAEARPGTEPAAAVTGGLLSLAIEIPRYGTRLDFVKTGGGPDLTLSMVDRGLVQMGVAGGAGLAALLVALIITSWRGLVKFTRVLCVAVPLAMAAVGVWSVVVGFYVAVGIPVAAVGVALLVWRLITIPRRRTRRAAA